VRGGERSGCTFCVSGGGRASLRSPGAGDSSERQWFLERVWRSGRRVSAMGLAATGDHGVKAIIKSRFAQAGRTYATLGDVRRAVGVERANVAASLDGNVLMMQVPNSAASFSAYTGIVTNAIRSAMGSAAVVVVVFDEPAHLTVAKREEQARRDAQRKKTVPVCSEELFPYPTDDSYGIGELTSTTDCHAIVRCRASRQRFFDETGRQVLINLKKSIATWAQGGSESVVLFDGLDPRGALREYGAPREPCVFGSDDAVAALFQREHAIGEGDLKLAWVEQRVRELAVEGKLPTQLNLTITIDTDSIAIELMERARRACAPAECESDAVLGALCMRERSHKRDAWDDDPGAVYFVLDYAHLFEMIQTQMWGRGRTLPPPEKQRSAMALLCAGWALAGCDFVALRGLKADMVLEAMPSLLRTAPQLVDLMENTWSGDRDAAKEVLPALKRLVLLCAVNYEDQPRARKATVEAMRNHDKASLLRAAWVASYWSMHEFAGSLHDFGFTYCGGAAASRDLAAAVEPKGVPAAEPRVLSRFFAPQEAVEDATGSYRLPPSASALDQFAFS
jgi:hypothetical protein